jgi:hypothetical protein
MDAGRVKSRPASARPQPNRSDVFLGEGAVWLGYVEIERGGAVHRPIEEADLQRDAARVIHEALADA